VTTTDTGASAEHTIDQANGCVASLAQPSASIAAAGGSGSVDVTLSDPSCPWSARSNAPFVTGVTPSGTGSATVAFTVAAQDGPARTGTIAIAERTFTVEQASGCVVEVSQPDDYLPFSGKDTFKVRTAVGCRWMTAANAPWVHDVTPSGTGAGKIAFSYDGNPGAPRSTSITVRSLDSGATADHGIRQGGCFIPSLLGGCP
jgi:hypothetical protein